MKKLFIFMFVVAMSFISCNKDDDNDPLVGTWVWSYTDYDGTVYLDEITFNSDNTGTNIISNTKDGITAEGYFTWSTDKNILSGIRDGKTYSAIYAISGNKLTLNDDVYMRK